MKVSIIFAPYRKGLQLYMIRFGSVITIILYDSFTVTFRTKIAIVYGACNQNYCIHMWSIFEHVQGLTTLMTHYAAVTATRTLS